MLEIQTFLSLGFATNTIINYNGPITSPIAKEGEFFLFKTHSNTNPLNLSLTQSQTIEQTY